MTGGGGWRHCHSLARLAAREDTDHLAAVTTPLIDRGRTEKRYAKRSDGFSGGLGTGPQWCSSAAARPLEPVLPEPSASAEAQRMHHKLLAVRLVRWQGALPVIPSPRRGQTHRHVHPTLTRTSHVHETASEAHPALYYGVGWERIGGSGGLSCSALAISTRAGDGALCS